MQRETLTGFRNWFFQYLETFYSSLSKDQQRNIHLKECHTERVCLEAVNLGTLVHLSADDLYLLETAALFHDLGRFEQWQRYGTFRDAQSENHALLALKVLDKHKILVNLSSEEQTLIRQAIRYHNVLHVPDLGNQRAMLLINLLRDADKLDIWRLFTEYFRLQPEEQDHSVEWDLPQTSSYSKEILLDLHQQRITSLDNLKNRHDFKLLLLSWIFDLNFLPARQQVLERKYIEEICAHLPQTLEILEMRDKILAYLRSGFR